MPKSSRVPSYTHFLWLALLLLLLAGCDMAGGGDAGSPDAPSPVPGEGSGAGEGQTPSPQPGQLTAGEWRDLDNWDYWLTLLEKPKWSRMQGYWTFYPTAHRPVRVVSRGEAVVDATVTLQNAQGEALWESRTDAQGRAEVFFSLFDETSGPCSLSVTSGLSSESVTNVTAGDTPLEVTLPSAAPPSNTLDLMFMVDTTGSMSDELEYLKVELQDVIDKVKAASVQTLDLRLSVNVYRDRGDEYVVRSFPFSTDVPAVIVQLEAQHSDGGGDYPEAVEEALKNAINDHDWSKTARARLLFLVLDAPPHHEQGILETLQGVTERAALQGIRVIPVASSGVDKETEFLLRFLGISTGGSYVFLTDDSGIGNDHIEPTVGRYEVELLNDLLVRVISEAVVVQE